MEPTPASSVAAAPSGRRRGGRPALPDSERRGHAVTFWVTPAELVALETRAASAGSVSAYVREAALTRPVAPSRRQRGGDIGPVVAQLARLGNNLNQAIYEARIRNFPPSTARAAEAAMQALGAYLRKLAAASDDDPET